MIGIGLGLCVQDLILGKMEMEEVDSIILLKLIRNPKELAECVETLKIAYWSKNPILATEFLECLFVTGRVLVYRRERRVWRLARKVLVSHRWLSTIKDLERYQPWVRR